MDHIMLQQKCRTLTFHFNANFYRFSQFLLLYVTFFLLLAAAWEAQYVDGTKVGITALSSAQTTENSLIDKASSANRLRRLSPVAPSLSFSPRFFETAEERTRSGPSRSQSSEVSIPLNTFVPDSSSDEDEAPSSTQTITAQIHRADDDIIASILDDISVIENHLFPQNVERNDDNYENRFESNKTSTSTHEESNDIGKPDTEEAAAASSDGETLIKETSKRNKRVSWRNPEIASYSSETPTPLSLLIDSDGASQAKLSKWEKCFGEPFTKSIKDLGLGVGRSIIKILRDYASAHEQRLRYNNIYSHIPDRKNPYIEDYAIPRCAALLYGWEEMHEAWYNRARLNDQRLCIMDVIGNGDCLFSAIVHGLRAAGIKKPDETFYTVTELRKISAATLAGFQSQEYDTLKAENWNIDQFYETMSVFLSMQEANDWPDDWSPLNFIGLDYRRDLTGKVLYISDALTKAQLLVSLLSECGNTHWGTATDIESLEKYFNVGFIIFDGQTAQIYNHALKSRSWPKYILLYYTGKHHFKKMGIVTKSKTCFLGCDDYRIQSAFNADDIPDFILDCFTLDTRRPFLSEKQHLPSLNGEEDHDSDPSSSSAPKPTLSDQEKEEESENLPTSENNNTPNLRSAVNRDEKVKNDNSLDLDLSTELNDQGA
ncbi:hypothetical protein IE077_000076 [Cardiosporidium cionae]|uniref:OTU domain-containing protein n=1 Tax=Cardiosporidium cionae TaxID=476202 RepID=A0ABQ7JDK1_9APIC|nr:hypothetical protein IE077_000076 [Cardiosporidium cionae]|eukprot:KAF8822080.1 hypothetical protein IE077_000076 [Cardiosporidium cionae]